MALEALLIFKSQQGPRGFGVVGAEVGLEEVEIRGQKGAGLLRFLLEATLDGKYSKYHIVH